VVGKEQARLPAIMSLENLQRPQAGVSPPQIAQNRRDLGTPVPVPQNRKPDWQSQARASSPQKAKNGLAEDPDACAPQFIQTKKEAAFFCGLFNQSTKVNQPKLINHWKSCKPSHWQADEEPPANESQNLAMGAPPAAPVAGIVIVCSVKTPLVTVAPFGTMSEGWSKGALWLRTRSSVSDFRKATTAILSRVPKLARSRFGSMSADGKSPRWL
jgi:hypothetical protein